MKRPVDKLWQRVVALVMETRDDWRRRASAATGLPFSRIRALRRLDGEALSLRALAYAMSCDAPAATVAVNDLERRGLVERRPHPADRRVKLVSLTPAGRRTLAIARRVEDRAPDAWARLAPAEIAALERALGRLEPTLDPD